MCGFVWWEMLGGDDLFTKSCPTLAIPWTVVCQAPLSMGFSRQEHWDGLPCPPPRDLPNPGTELASVVSPVLAGGFFVLAPPGKQASH